MFLVARTASDAAALSSAIVQRNPRRRSFRCRLRNTDHAGPSLRFACAPALLQHACWAHLRRSRCCWPPWASMACCRIWSPRARTTSACCVALGCAARNILTLVVRQGMELALIGIFAGLAGAVAVTRVIASLLFGVSATDAHTFVAVPALLAAVAFAATVIPAWRATRVDPMVALREE